MSQNETLLGSKMKVTSVKITVVPGEDRLKAYASIIFDDCFVVHDLKIIRTDDKLFVSMPSKRHKNQSAFRDIAHPLNRQTRSMIQNAVFAEYESTLKGFKADKESINMLNPPQAKEPEDNKD